MECLRKHLAYNRHLKEMKKHDDDAHYYFRDGPLSLELESSALSQECQKNMDKIETEMHPMCYVMHKLLTKLNL